MRVVVALDAPDDFDGWRAAARRLVGAGVSPDGVVWQVAGAQADLFGSATMDARGVETLPDPPAFAVDKRFVGLARAAILHREPERFALLHRLLAGMRDRSLSIDDRAHPLITRLEALAKTVRRDIHKMRAFVRFRTMTDDAGERFVAWFEPDHHIVRANARFFIDRFASMRWSILTPELSVHWDGAALTEGPGAVRGDAPDGDPVEEAWKRYYASIFNPARLKVGAMLKEMPRKYWANMPETALVGELIAGAQARSAAMVAASAGQHIAPLPAAAPGSAMERWQALREEAKSCQRCPLYARASCTVWGEGPLDAPLMLVGEQPGDEEDKAGRAFVGPAGKVLDAALEEAGIDRARVYLTNAVKHFNYVWRGKRRLHQSPEAGHIEACRWWLGQERAIVQPKLVLALGATAARALTGRVTPVGRMRGRSIELPDGALARVTTHPSFLLRLPDAGQAATARADFIADLRAAASTATMK